MSSRLNTTHLLEAESFSQGFTTLLERLLPETTTGVVWLEMENIEMSPDGETCRRTWDTVREHFIRRPSEDDGDRIAWSCSTTTDVG